MKKKSIIFIAAFLTWIFLSWPPDTQQVLAGIACGFIVTFLNSDIFGEKLHFPRHLKNYLWFVYYIFFFIWECVKANIDGAYRVIHPSLPIKPGIVKVRTTLTSDTALAFLANSLTLQPGTMTVDIDKENGFLYVHWIDVKSQDIEKATESIVFKFERILKKVFEF